MFSENVLIVLFNTELWSNAARLTESASTHFVFTVKFYRAESNWILAVCSVRTWDSFDWLIKNQPRFAAGCFSPSSHFRVESMESPQTFRRSSEFRRCETRSFLTSEKTALHADAVQFVRKPANVVFHIFSSVSLKFSFKKKRCLLKTRDFML